MNEQIPVLIKRIVEYKWHGNDDYAVLKADIEKIADKETRDKLLSYLNEAREFSERSIMEKEVEEELLEKWLLDSAPMKMRYKNGRYTFELKDVKDENNENS